MTLDLLLDAQRRRAEAESAYYRSLVDYNQAIMNVHYRKGSLLDYDGVYLAEGPWPAKAYFDALRQARKRDAGLYIDYGYTRPNVISRGPIPQGCTGGLRHGRTARTRYVRGPRSDAGRGHSRGNVAGAGHFPAACMPRRANSSSHLWHDTHEQQANHSPRQAAGNASIWARAEFRRAGRGVRCGTANDLSRLGNHAAAGVPLKFDHIARRFSIIGASYLPPTDFTADEALSLLALAEGMGRN